jgi:ABC-type bacteriocin/lantibiotic exporter with double-glycine peptidase domain
MVFNDIITYILPNITFLFIITGYFLYSNLLFGLIFILGNLVLIAYLYFNWGDMIAHNEEYEKYVNDNESYLVEILNNIDKIIYRGQTETEINEFSKKTDKSIHSAFNFYSNTAYHSTMMNIMVFIIIFLCIWQIIYMFFNKSIGLKLFITFFTILLLYRDRILTVIQQIPDFIEFLGRSDSVVKHFKTMANDYEKVLKTKYNNHFDLPFDKITFENVTFKYKSGFSNVLDHFSKTIYLNHKIIGIVGLSGNGKSTFAKLIIKLYIPDFGNIYIDNQNIDKIDGNYIRNNITNVNKNTKLFKHAQKF